MTTKKVCYEIMLLISLLTSFLSEIRHNSIALSTGDVKVSVPPDSGNII